MKNRAMRPAAAMAPIGPAPVVLGGRVKLPSDVPPPPTLPDVASYILVDDATGTVIAAKAPDLRLPPASLTKLMTAYLTYRALRAGTIHINQTVPVSLAAWRTMGSRMFIEPNQPVTIGQLIAGLMIDSGNDAAVALAQAVAGTRPSFVAMMQGAATQLHLTDTHYTNVDGLPDPGLYTSARDVARLSRALITQYPQIFNITKQQHDTYNHITQRNWNPVVFRDPTVDGLKTGLTAESGHCIDATALRRGRRLIAVVMGGPSWHASADDIEALLDYGYRFFTDRAVLAAGDVVGRIRNPLMDPRLVAVGVTKRLVVVLPASRQAVPTTTLELNAGLKPPIAEGEVVGTVAIDLAGATLANEPAVALAATAPAGFAQRWFYDVRQLW
ncbi:MAG TPA: D-alanyl-D-alanine carboxypeptidase family protein [Stellaceae bacterium]|nr:D-alanyl-D-alanine carboxypeptidase family protein [Stellaceae bacterium]